MTKTRVNRRLYNNQFFVETAIYRVSFLTEQYWHTISVQIFSKIK
ncbi:MAG: hypothetical protein RM021_016860 [Nostoc sp. EkiNYC01]|nr:hypothetical protein [Nostoc sp. EkiNYC01]